MASQYQPQLSPRTNSTLPHCSLCHSPYDLYYHLPHVLPKCGHTHCQQCISTRVASKGNRRVFSCPLCQVEVIIRKGVAEDIPKNISIIDIIKRNKKYQNSGEKEDKSYLSMVEVCHQHQKPLELLCETCSNSKICSHCVLFGSHKDHTFRKQHLASKVDIDEVREVFELISDSVRAVLMPGSKGNIREVVAGRVREGLGKAVSGAFKQYYEVLRRREAELMEECSKIVIGQGGIDRNIDQLLHDYDALQTVFNRDFKQGGGVGVAEVQGYISKCKQLHNSIEHVQQHAKAHIEKIVKDTEVYIRQSCLFKITEMPFTLKEAVERSQGMKSARNSPDKKQRAKCASQDNKAAEKVKSTMKKSSDNFYNSKGKKETLSQIEKVQIASQSSGVEPQAFKSQLNPARQATVRHDRNNLPPKATRFKPNQSQDLQKTVTFKQSKESHASSSSKPFLTAQSPNKTVSVTNPAPPLSPSQLKFAPPTKELPFQLVSKHHTLIGQIDRQGEASILELVSAQINDAIMPYLLQHIRKKQYRFQIIKMVKNNLTDEGLRILLSYLTTDRTTQVLNLTSNQLSQRSLDWLIHFAQINPILRTIYLSNNKISAFHVKVRKTDLSKLELEVIV